MLLLQVSGTEGCYSNLTQPHNLHAQARNCSLHVQTSEEARVWQLLRNLFIADVGVNSEWFSGIRSCFTPLHLA